MNFFPLMKTVAGRGAPNEWQDGQVAGNTTASQSSFRCQRYTHGAASWTCMVLRAVHAWCCRRYMHGAASSTCMVLPAVHAWCCEQYMHGAAGGTCMVLRAVHA
eukprot:365455-Chlamydomonas_euryale.AAC.21